MRALMWFRSDLRVDDNIALAEACRRADQGVIACFAICLEQWRAHDWGVPKIDFVIRALNSLARDLDRLNIPLRILHSDTFDRAGEQVVALATEVGAGAIFFNREYELNESLRDERVEELAGERAIAVYPRDDQVVLAPGLVRTRSDSFYTVFTPFARRFRELLAEHGGLHLHPPPPPRDAPACPADAVPQSLPGVRQNSSLADLWPASERAARERLAIFAADRLRDYHEQRDRPDLNATSGLSPYLSAGLISPRRCLEAAGEIDADALAPKRTERNGPTVWVNELIWREFYRHLLVAFPRLSMHRAFRPQTERIAWRDDAEAFEAWRTGRTGFPIIDAAMRQLAETAWMHNRLRMIVAMFLTKNLLIDWRRGERYFMNHLVDADLANNNGGWQWSASTGTDAAPYFRIYNPCAQAARYDPDARFIRRWLPELADLPPDALHDPSKMAPLARERADYPETIVDLAATRARAIDAFKALS